MNRDKQQFMVKLDRVFYLSWKYDMKGMKKNGTEKENFWSIR